MKIGVCLQPSAVVVCPLHPQIQEWSVCHFTSCLVFLPRLSYNKVEVVHVLCFLTIHTLWPSFPVDALLMVGSMWHSTRPGPTNNDTCVFKTHTEDIHLLTPIFSCPFRGRTGWRCSSEDPCTPALLNQSERKSVSVFHPVYPVQFPPFSPSEMGERVQEMISCTLSTYPFQPFHTSPVLSGKCPASTFWENFFRI